MAAQELVATQRDGDVLIIRLANPESRNSMTMEMREQLGAAIALAEREPGIRAVFLTGDGPTFCSGGDLNHLRTACDPWTVHRRFRNLSRWLTPLITLDKPVVVGVNGHAVGGGMGLALTGDVVIAGDVGQRCTMCVVQGMDGGHLRGETTGIVGGTVVADLPRFWWYVPPDLLGRRVRPVGVAGVRPLEVVGVTAAEPIPQM